MSEYESTIRAMMAMANADEGDRITSSDLAECEAAVCIIQDLQAENKVMHENMLTVVGASTALKAEVARLREFFKSEIAHMETWERHAMAARFKQALQDSGDAAGGE